ncbi:related to YEA4-uridine diphosphate-N-acetylglucosamine [Sporisorium reilianum f. sp. reilianum]|uniref:Related to YEA4-uridine diphosphate-N-acetylglucosamine n=1 Tax=Sporisorium reilianum f. sp. reilianum TaxID=72559 RepID=A0A2N8U8B9_9BASI|nr:related to YEA4-uridine diphosphate-N-acetylglucosamine [Sporisorium reilianum f. sp. reilianum]
MSTASTASTDSGLRQRKPPKPSSNGFSSTSTASAILATTAPEWLLILSLIFGGCCSNAYTLELATRQLPSAGTLITFAQFVVTTLSTLPHFVRLSTRLPCVRLRPRAVPLYRWIVQVAFYLTTSLLNNMAFAYDVPMPVHIVFRSGGLVINMILGWAVQGRHYSGLQVGSVVLVTVGVVSSTLYSSAGSGEVDVGADASEYATGVLLLFSALVLTGFMGLWQEHTFKQYGNQNWRESLFYSHLLSLPIFALRPTSLIRDIHHANATTPWWFGFGPPPISSSSTAHHAPQTLLHRLTALFPITTPAAARKDTTRERIFDLTLLPPLTHIASFLPANKGLWIPSFYPPLALNVATQLLCINGVNRLTSKVSSLSVTLVLVVRKALSLLVSVMVVERSSGSVGLWCGAAAVLAGTVGYSVSKPVAVRVEGKDGKAE